MRGIAKDRASLAQLVERHSNMETRVQVSQGAHPAAANIFDLLTDLVNMKLYKEEHKMDTQMEQEKVAYRDDRLWTIKEMQDMAYKLRCNILEIKMESELKDKVSEILENFETELCRLEDEEKKKIDNELESQYKEAI